MKDICGILSCFGISNGAGNDIPKSNLGGNSDPNLFIVIPPGNPRVRTYADRTFGPVALPWKLENSESNVAEHNWTIYETTRSSTNESVKKILDSKWKRGAGEIKPDLKTRIGGHDARNRSTFVALVNKLEQDLKDLSGLLEPARQQDLNAPLTMETMEVMHARKQVQTTLSMLASDIAQHRRTHTFVLPLISVTSLLIGFGLNVAANIAPMAWVAWTRLFPSLFVMFPVLYTLCRVSTDMEDGGIHQLEKSVDKAFKTLFEAPIVADALRLHILERALEAVVKSRDYEDPDNKRPSSSNDSEQPSSSNDTERPSNSKNNELRKNAAKQAINSVLTDLKLDKIFLATEVTELANRVEALLSERIGVFVEVEGYLTAKVKDHYSAHTERTQKHLISRKMRKFKQTLEDARLNPWPNPPSDEGRSKPWAYEVVLNQEASGLIDLYLQYRAELKLATEATTARKAEKANANAEAKKSKEAQELKETENLEENEEPGTRNMSIPLFSKKI